MQEERKDERIYKTHVFRVGAEWTGGRTWVNKAEGAADVPGGPPPVFGGEPGRWTPEDLMLASVNSCQVGTFISYCIRKRFEFVSLECTTEGELEHDGKGYKFTKMVVRPRVVVRSEGDVETAREYLEKAHETCFMSNSVIAEVEMEPEIVVAGQAQTE